MNKTDLIERIAASTGITRAQAEKTIDTFTGTIKAAVKKGDDVMIRDFGTFTKIKRKARAGRNPQTGKTINIPAAWKTKFKASKEFKALVR